MFVIYEPNTKLFWSGVWCSKTVSYLTDDILNAKLFKTKKLADNCMKRHLSSHWGIMQTSKIVPVKITIEME